MRACAVEMHMNSHFVQEFSQKCCPPRARQGSAVEMHMGMSEEQFDARIYKENIGKCWGPKLRLTFCASLRDRNAHGHVRRAVLCENSQGKCRGPRSGKHRAADFVRACAVEMHMKISQEPFYSRIYSKNAGDQMEHPDLTPVF